MKRTLALRDRLALAFTLALVIAYLAIAIGAVLVVHRTLRASVDGRLSTVTGAIVTIADDDRDEIDANDRAQFASVAADASGAVVLDAKGELVLSTTGDIPPWLFGAIHGAAFGRVFTAHATGHDVRILIDRRRAKHGDENRIVVWQSMQLVHDVERNVLVVIGVFGLLVTAGGYAIGAQIARRGLLPLTRITAIVADIAANDLHARVGPQPHADELGQLAATFDRMLDRLQSAFERQRQFTADASHDLRAPLATLRAEVDLALRRERSPADYRAALEAIANDADQLDRLIDALLAAARSEGGTLDLRPLDLPAIVRHSVDEIAPFARARGVEIETAIDDESVINGDAGLIGRAIIATLHNAAKFTPPTHAIHVAVTKTGGRVELRVRDEGPGFSSAALVHALERFWRDDAARGRSGGSGLGLAIASEIVRRCGGSIAIDNPATGGAEVVMAFPALPAPARVPGRSA